MRPALARNSLTLASYEETAQEKNIAAAAAEVRWHQEDQHWHEAGISALTSNRTFGGPHDERKDPILVQAVIAMLERSACYGCDLCEAA